MSDQAFDPTQLQEAIYAAGDVAGDPAAAATALRTLLDQLQGQQPGGHQAAGVGPGGSSTVVGGEATPRPGMAPVEVLRLDEAVEDVKRQAALLGDADRQDLLRGFAAAVNEGLDRNAAEAAPHLHPRKVADTDEELADLGGRITAAWTDPGAVSEAEVHGLASELNRMLDGLNDAHLQRVDDFERQRVQAEQARLARARTEVGAAKALRQVAGQLDPGR